MTDEPSYDLLCMGRSCIDLYSNDIGAPFEQITEFSAFVGGCPTNISTAARRLGVKSSLFTGVGEDPVGDFILNFLDNEDIDRRYTVRKPGRRSSAVILGIEPPDKFPLVYYRDNCADIALTIEDVQNIPIEKFKALLISGTGLSKEPSRTATIYAAEVAAEHDVAVFLDIDFRADQWPDIQTFGSAVRSVLSSVDYLIGTSTEIKAAAYKGTGKAQIEHSQVNESRVEADLLESIQTLLQKGPKRLFQKAGTDGCYIYEHGNNEKIHVPGFPVEVVNTLGAGDGFAGGLFYGFLNNWDWYKTVRFANACGAYLVTQHGCANFMPTQENIQSFIKEHGGL
ncbi:MAG: 5-dehydro-2-deoxygluconokinase [Balneolaceae bacterium]|nr:5-dehydro-2-deoxygluconokinase [Balneolaceae bacterium]